MKRVVMLLFLVNIASIHAMQKVSPKFENKKHESKSEWEILIYPKDAEIKLDEKLEKEYQRIGNEFMVPKGMDAKLIHPTLIPERCDNFAIGHVADRPY